MPRFQSPPRRTQWADFPLYAHLFASHQGLCDLSCWCDFQLRAYAYIPPLPTPPPPAEALSILKPRNARTFQPSPLTYSLRLGSCTLMDAFIISSVPSRLKETLQTAGPPHSVGVTPLHLLRTHPSPSRLRSTSRFSQLYDLPCSGDFSSGARRASPVTRCVLVTVLSLPPRRRGVAAPVRFRPPMLPSPSGSGLGPRISTFRGHFCVHSVTARRLVDLSKRDPVDRLQDFGFPPPCYPNYGAPDF